MNPFNNLNPAPNIGAIMQQGWERGQAKRKEQETQNALMQYAMNPDDPKAYEGLARTAPQIALQERQRRQQAQQAQLEAHRENIIKGAQIFRQLGVKDEQSYQVALQMAQRVGIDLREVPPNFDPQYVQGVVAIADTFAPQKQENQPSSVQEFQYAQAQGFKGNYMDFMEQKRGPIVANNGDGTFTLIPRGGMAPQQQAQGVPPLPPGFVLDGGPTQPASGGFPTGGN